MIKHELSVFLKHKSKDKTQQLPKARNISDFNEVVLKTLNSFHL